MIEKKINEFLSSPKIAGLAESTQDSYRYALLSAFLPLIRNNTQMLSSPVCALDLFVVSLENKNLSGATIQQYLTIVKLFLKWNGTPIEYTYRVKSKERKAVALKKMNRWFDEDDIEKCLSYKHDNPRNELMVHLLIETGMRIQELSDILVEDIDRENRIIKIKTSKTRPRVVFFSPATKLKIEGVIVWDLLALPISAKIFPSTEQIYAIVRNMLEDLGLKKGADGRGPHTFRHYCATYLFYTGNMRLEDVARVLGDTPDVIERQYIHPTPKMLRQRVDKAMGWT